MSLNRFFVDAALLVGDRVEIRDDNLTHIRLALRLRVGEQVVLCDGAGNDALCTLEKITDDMALCRVEERRSSIESGKEIHLFFGLPKGDKTEMIIEKSVELGATEITPFISSRCIARPDEKALAKRLPRWQAIAESAAKQSGRGRIPKVNPAVSFAQLLSQVAEKEKALFFFEDALGNTIAKKHADYNSVALITGAEGGFSPEEAEKLSRLPCVETLTLGKRILRCETAPLCALAVLTHYQESGNNDNQ